MALGSLFNLRLLRLQFLHKLHLFPQRDSKMRIIHVARFDYGLRILNLSCLSLALRQIMRSIRGLGRWLAQIELLLMVIVEFFARHLEHLGVSIVLRLTIS